MTGNLAQRAPADILSEVQRRQISGILSLRHNRLSRQIYVDAGVMIRFAASSHPSESLTAWFLERGGVGEETLRTAALQKKPEELLGTTLVRLGLITAKTLAEITETHIRRVVREALSMPEGTYEFLEGALPFREQLDAGLATAEALLEWTRNIHDPEWMRRRLGSLDERVLRHRRPPEGYQRIRLDPTEGYIMSRVDGSASMREICMVSPMGDERTLGALLGLALAGVLEMPAAAVELPAPKKASDAQEILQEPERPAATEKGATRGPAASFDPMAVTTDPFLPRLVPQSAAPRPNPPAPVAMSTTYASVPQSNASESVHAQRPKPQSAPAPLAVPTPAAAPSPSAPAAGGPPRPVAAPRPAAPGTGAKPRPTGSAGGAKRPAKPAAGAPKLRVVEPPPPVRFDAEPEMLQRFENIHVLDLYQVLGVSPSSYADDIRRAYYGLARQFHPDTFRRDDLKAKAEKVFGRITEAYSTLSRAESRSKYDEERRIHGDKGHGDKANETPDLPRMNFLRGKESYEHGRFPEALSFFVNACQQDPSKSEYFEYLGLTQSKNPRFRKQAEESLQRAIDLAPSSGRAYAHLGAFYERLGLADKAREMYKKALEWDPANEIALKGLPQDAPAKKGLLGLFSRK